MTMLIIAIMFAMLTILFELVSVLSFVDYH